MALRSCEPLPGQGASDLGPEIVAALGYLGQPVQERLEGGVVLGGQQGLPVEG